MAHMSMAVRRFQGAFVEVRRAQTRVGHQPVPRCAAGATARMVGRRTFTVENDRFLLDGEPLQIISGSVHYFRIHPDYWKDRLQRIAALGCNAIEVYVPWNWHEPQRGQLRFDGWHDLEGFLQLAHVMDLRVLLRPGPYICAEWELGGLPAWLLNPSVTGTDSIGLRSHDPVYMKFVHGWWETLLPRMVPLLHRNGGPIVMVQVQDCMSLSNRAQHQTLEWLAATNYTLGPAKRRVHLSVKVENELGFFGPDEAYVRELVSLARLHLGDDVLLFTTDPPHVVGKGSLRGGDVLSLVDFGTDMDLRTAFWAQNRFNPPGMSPPFCTEFYCGWLTHWGEPMARTDGQELATALQNLLEFADGTGNVNLYMAHGGTTFGFWQGANDDHRGYRPDVTSYDYHCPISEAGGYDHPGLGGESKYQLLRNVIARHTGRALPEPPPPPHIQDYGTITILQQLPLLDALPQLSCPRPVASQHPLPMEHYGIYYGFILYRATLEPGRLQQGGLLAFKAADYVQVFLDGSLVASWDRNHPHPVRLPAGTRAATLDIFVENMGRNNFFRDRADCKGILSRVTVDGTPVTSWIVYGLPLERLQPLDDIWRPLPPRDGAVEAAGQPGGDTADASAVRFAEVADCAEGPRFFSGTFRVEAPGQLQEFGQPCDSYLSMAAWRKGVVWVNGFNLGRYWTAQGPQRTLYVPGPVLVAGENRVVVLELDPQDPLPPVLQFVTLPDFGCQPLPSAPGPLAGLEKALRSTGLCLWQFLYGAWLRCCV